MFFDQQVSFSLINSKTTFSPAGGRDEADGGQAQGEKNSFRLVPQLKLHPKGLRNFGMPKLN